MNADLTISTLTFTQAYNDKVNGSERREISRGVNLPEIMRIRHGEYIDNKTKLPGVQSQVKFERHVALTDGRIAPVEATLTVKVLSDANIGSADVLAVVERIAQVIQEDDTGLDLPDEIFVSKQQ
jgi:hypothetical protein